ncbi:hypothetical protein [Mesorhizobium sp. M0254]|uniref:hypothetical protein n=1 Tax=Mesorhizobium sp. M0254 TaxID=2956927 RepID=UPI003337AEFC
MTKQTNSGCAVERAQIDADLAQRRFMLVDPNNRLVADTLEREWNDKLRMLADLREERESALREDRATFDDAIRDRLIAMTADFKTAGATPPCRTENASGSLPISSKTSYCSSSRPREKPGSTSASEAEGPKH